MTLLDDQAPADEKKPDNLDTKKQGQQADDVPGWLKSAKDDKLKTGDALKTLGRFKGDTPDELAVSYLSLRQKMGENPVALPGKDDPPEKWNEFYENNFGVPKDPAGYKESLKLPEKHNDEVDNAFFLEAKKLNLAPRQVQGLYDWLDRFGTESSAKQAETAKKADDDNMAELTKLYGHDLSKNVQIADMVLTKVFPAGAADKLRKAGLNRDPEIFAGLVKAGQSMFESDIKGLQGGAPIGGKKSKAELEQMMKDPRYKKDEVYTEMVQKEFERSFPGNQE